MNVIKHANSDEMKVWLTKSEVELMLNEIEDTQKYIAVCLGVRCGLRSAEWLDVKPRDLKDTDAGSMLRVHQGKGDKYREVPVPTELSAMIRAAGDYTGRDNPVLQVDSTRSLRRWVQTVGAHMGEITDNPDWLELSTHDLRRTWATQLSDHEVDPMICLQWGGWNDLDTFLDHYKGAFSPAAQRRNREKVDWLQ